MSRFFSRLSYSLCNEDWDVEHRALKIKPSDSAVCITASGDRPLHLLLDNCKEVVSVDANPSQNYLLNLKIAALRAFDYEHYLSFLGATPDKHRREGLQKLIKLMNPAAAQYWQQQRDSIIKGVLYQGALEKRVCTSAKILRFLRPEKTKQLFNFDDIESQKSFIDNEWDNFYWRRAFDIALHPFVTRFLLNDPGLYAYVDPSIHPASYLCQRIIDGLKRDVAKKNTFVSLVFQGRVDPEAFPPYLTEEGYNIIKKRFDRIAYHTTDIISYLESVPEQSFDIFSLSDVASYISEEEFNRLLLAVYKAARPGARFCMREFMSRRKIPQHLQPVFFRDTELEQQLEKQDRCYVYRFMVGHIAKTK